MGESNIPANARPPRGDDARKGLDRLGASSDGVIAVIITVMVLQLKAPKAATFSALAALWPSLVSYGVSYLFIAIIWLNHHHLTRLAREPTLKLVWLNFAHLFLVSLVPLATQWVAATGLASAPVSAYAGVFVAVDVAYLLFEREVMAQADGRRASADARRQVWRRSMGALALFASAGPAALLAPWLSMALIGVALSFFIQPEVRAMQLARPPGPSRVLG